MKTLGKLATAVATLSLFASGVFAAPAVNNQDINEKLLKKIDQLEKRLANQESKINQLESKKVSAVDRDQIADVMKDILADTKARPAQPSWMKNLKFFGDLRFRYEYSRQCKNRDNYANGLRDRNRALYRLRFGFTKTWWDDQLLVSFRIATSSENSSASAWGDGNGNPRSGNVTMGGLFSKKSVFIDRAYAAYKPNWAKGLTIQAGKMPGRPGIRTATDLTMETDVSPEGIVFDYQVPASVSAFRPYVTGGWFSVQENSAGYGVYAGSKRDVSLLFASAGFNWMLDKEAGLEWFLGASLWHFTNYDAAHPFPFDAGNQPTRAPKMRMVEVTSSVTWKMFDQPWKAWGSWVNNCAGTSQTPIAPVGQDTAWGIGIRVGKNKAKGDWSVEYAWKYIGANAVSHLTQAVFQGPNRKGHSLFARYNIDKKLTLHLGLWSTEPIKYAAGNDDRKFTTRVELLWKF